MTGMTAARAIPTDGDWWAMLKISCSGEHARVACAIVFCFSGDHKTPFVGSDF